MRHQTARTGGEVASDYPRSMELDLTEVEARVIGCLVEKEATTPDVYPLTTNSLVTACNQKSNRDPVVSFSAIQVDEALKSLRQKQLVRAVHIQGSRSTKHRHVLDEGLGVSGPLQAVLAVLMLRGPQTVGELRTRTERLHPFARLEDVDATLHQLEAMMPPLVTHLERAPGQKERRWSHLLSSSSAAASVEAPASESGATNAATSPPVAAAPVSAAPVAAPVSAVIAANQSDDLQELQNELVDLRQRHQALKSRFDTLCARLGEDL